MLGAGSQLGSETASPTIPALRATPFSQPAVPRLALAANKASLTPTQPGAEQQQQQQQQQQGRPTTARLQVPRLALTAGMHSNLEQRTASAELAAAAEAEAARRAAGRGGYFGDLERNALGKGKVQAAAVRHSRVASMSGEGSWPPHASLQLCF